MDVQGVHEGQLGEPSRGHVTESVRFDDAESGGDGGRGERLQSFSADETQRTHSRGGTARALEGCYSLRANLTAATNREGVTSRKSHVTHFNGVNSVHRLWVYAAPRTPYAAEAQPFGADLDLYASCSCCRRRRG